MNRRGAALVGVAAIAVAALWMWRQAGTPDERAIRERFDAFAAEFNASTTDGLGTVARAARLGQYFTADVVVELGEGSTPIRGRDTLIGMAARLQPRTAAFALEFEDVTVEWSDGTRAEATFTLMIRRRSMASGEESLDAREFAAEMRTSGGEWQVARAVAIDTLR